MWTHHCVSFVIFKGFVSFFSSSSSFFFVVQFLLHVLEKRQPLFTFVMIILIPNMKPYSSPHVFFYSIGSYYARHPCVYADGLPVHNRPLRIWVKCSLVFRRSGVGLRFCLFDKLDSDVAGPAPGIHCEPTAIG